MTLAPATKARVSRALVVITCGVVAGLAAWRLHCVTLGPDPDTDAYGHYVIGRQLLETPTNTRIHWVWLPFYHSVLAILIRFGLTLDDVRAINAVLAAAPPLILLYALDRARQPAEARGSLVPVLAALFAAGAPLSMQLGTTGQMEVFFSVVLLAAAVLLQGQRHALAAIALSVAVLTRYEAWPVAFVIATVLALGYARRRVVPSIAALAPVVVPALAVLGWAGLRWLQGEPWFGFILDNQSFAEGALRQTRADGHWWVAALMRYPLTVPALSFGLPGAFAVLGFGRTLRREGLWFVLVPLSSLAFLTLSSLSRSHLGLHRHFLPLIPFFATWMAHGVARSIEWISEAHARASQHVGADAGRALQGFVPSGNAVVAASSWLLVLGCVGSTLIRLDDSLHEWRATTAQALSSERALGRFLATLPASSLLVCDEASVEVLSGLPAPRFMRARVGPQLMDRVLEQSRNRDVFLISRSTRIDTVAALGPRVYTSSSGLALAVLQVRAPSNDAAVSSAATSSAATSSAATSSAATSSAVPRLH